MASDADIQAAFQECSSGGKIPANKVGTAARLAGASPSNAEAAQFASQVGGGADLTSFKAFCSKTLHPEDDIRDLTELFKGADLQGTGKIPKAAMKKMLQAYGEPLSDAEFDSVAKDFACDGGENIDYVAMLARLFQK